jgi:hypothetical protein
MRIVARGVSRRDLDQRRITRQIQIAWWTIAAARSLRLGGAPPGGRD